MDAALGILRIFSGMYFQVLLLGLFDTTSKEQVASWPFRPGNIFFAVCFCFAVSDLRTLGHLFYKYLRK